MALSFQLSAKYAAESSQSFMTLYRHISDVILNIARVHAAQKYQHENNLLKKRTEEYADKEYNLTFVSTGAYIFQSTFNDILKVVGLVMTVYLYNSNQISLSDFTQFHMLMGMIDHSLSSIGGNITFMINGVGTYRKFIDLLCTDLEDEI